MNYEDKTLTCLDCGQPFTFTVDEQTFHAEKGFTNEPKRCTSCRQARRGQRDGGYSQGGGQREMHAVVCAECGIDTTVPFKPRGDSPVYCNDCFNKRR